jgi:hypothetical protein
MAAMKFLGVTDRLDLVVHALDSAVGDLGLWSGEDAIEMRANVPLRVDWTAQCE